MTNFTPAQQAFLDQPHSAIIATTDGDGVPSQSIVWYLRVDDTIMVSIGPKSVKAKHIARDPHVSILVTNKAGSQYLRITGTAQVTGSLDPESRRKLVQNYVGADRIEQWLAEHPVQTPNARLIITPTHVAEYNLPKD